MDERLRKLEELAAMGDPEAIELIEQWQKKLKVETAEEREARLRVTRTKLISSRVNRIIEAGKERVRARGLPSYVLHQLESIEIYDGWAEGSGDSDKLLVVVADWNNPQQLIGGHHQEIDNTIGVIKDRLEKIKVIDVDWRESVTSCSDCGGAISTQPTHYGWTPPYAIFDDGVSCRACVQKSPDSYLESLEGDPDRALTPAMRINLIEHGYHLVPEQEYETGHHPGQNDSPTAVAQRLRHLGIERFIFAIQDQGQFDTHWVVYVAEDELYDLIQRASQETGFNNNAHFLDAVNEEMEFGVQIIQAAIGIIQEFLQDASLRWPSSLLEWVGMDQHQEPDNDGTDVVLGSDEDGNEAAGSEDQPENEDLDG